MKKYLSWIFGVAIALMLIAWLFVGRANRQAYRTARGAIEQRVELTQDRIDAVTEMAIAAVDLAYTQTAELPSQEAAADLVKQDIEEISNRLKEAADLRGQAAIDRLDQSIEQFNQALDTVDEASQQAENPETKAKLDRIYGILVTVQEQVTSFLLTAGQ